MKIAAAIACVALVAVGVAGAVQAPQLSIEEVLLAADRLRADRWYPEESEVGTEIAGRLNRAADMDLLVLASRHSRPELRYIAVREFGRFETPANVTFLAAFLNDPVYAVRDAAANALVQSVVDRPEATQEIAFVIAAIEDRLNRVVPSSSGALLPDRLWLRLADLPLPEATALKYEREWVAEIQQLTGRQHSAADALLRMLQVHPRPVDPATAVAVENWARAGLSQGDWHVTVGTRRRGETLQFLELLQAMHADTEAIAVDAAAFTCQDLGDTQQTIQECSAPIRDLGVRLLNPHNPRHQPALEAAARNRLHPMSSATAIRKLIDAPGMPFCILLEAAKGHDIEHEVIEALQKVSIERYHACGEWDVSQYLLNEAQALVTSTDGTTWVTPVTAYETLARRLAATETKGATRESLMALHNRVGVHHPRWEVRSAAARVATFMKDVATLATLAGDDHHNVRAEALKGLATLKSPLVFPAAIEALQFADTHLTITAANALAGMSDPTAALEAAFGALDRRTKERRDTSRRARLALLQRLAEFIPSRTVESPVWVNKLKPLLTDVDPAVAAAAAALIEKISGIPTRAQPTRRPGHQPTLAQVMAIPPCISLRLQGGRHDLPVMLNRIAAPLAVARVVELVNAGYYNNTVIHYLDANLGVGGSPAGNDEGGLERVIRDEVGDPGTRDPQLVLVGHERDYADGRLAIRYRPDPSRFRRETVVGRFLGPPLDFKGLTKGVTVSRLFVGAPERYRRNAACDPSRFGLPEIHLATGGWYDKR